MVKFKLSRIIDIIFNDILVFMLSLSLTRLLSIKKSICLLIGLIAVIFYNIVYFYIKSKKYTLNKIKFQFEKDLEDYMITFLSNTKQENLEFLKALFESKGFYTNTINYGLFLKKNNKNIMVLPYFEKKELDTTQVLKNLSIATQSDTKEIIVLCYEANNKDVAFLESISNVNIKIYTKKQIFYSILMPANFYPEIKFTFREDKKYKIKELLKLSINRNFVKRYFFSGLILFFSSFFVRANFYYLFFSSILFLLCLISLTKKNTIKCDDILNKKN